MIVYTYWIFIKTWLFVSNESSLNELDYLIFWNLSLSLITYYEWIFILLMIIQKEWIYFNKWLFGICESLLNTDCLYFTNLLILPWLLIWTESLFANDYSHQTVLSISSIISLIESLLTVDCYIIKNRSCIYDISYHITLFTS